MEYIVPIVIGAGTALLLVWVWTWKRRREERAWRKKVQGLRQDVEILQAKVRETQFIDLDLSSIETKIEEGKQELQLYVEQEVGSLSRDLDGVDERLEALEVDQDNEERIAELEERILDLEKRLQQLEARKP